MRRCNAINCELVARWSDHSISFSNEFGCLKKQTNAKKLIIIQMNQLSVFIVIGNLQLHKWIDINKTETFLVIDLYSGIFD